MRHDLYHYMCQKGKSRRYGARSLVRYVESTRRNSNQAQRSQTYWFGMVHAVSMRERAWKCGVSLLIEDDRMLAEALHLCHATTVLNTGRSRDLTCYPLM